MYLRKSCQNSQQQIRLREYSLQFPVGARGKDRYVPGQVKIQIRNAWRGAF
jgi:hypothetical protein